MVDLENHKINILPIPNQHTLVWGRSGQGKTFFCFRKVEEALKAGKRVMIIDYSGSYTHEEMRKARFAYIDSVIEFNPIEKGFCWCGRYDKSDLFQKDFADALLQVLGISSYFQKKLMREAVNNHFKKNEDLSLSDFLGTLEWMYDETLVTDGKTDDANNLNRLISRLVPYADVKGIHFRNEPRKKVIENKLVVLQLNDLSLLERKFFASLFMALLWEEIKHSEVRRTNLLLLDEFQNLSLKEDGAFYSMLREARRYELELLLSTQYISNYQKGEMEALLQVGNILIFNPTPTDLKFSAQVIDFENVDVWKKILKNLKTGEAVFKGAYHLNGNSKILTESIVCKI